MNRIETRPESKDHWLSLRLNDVTSTEASALFGISPYMTEFELWHQKKNKQTYKLEENDRMKWGTRLESSIAQGVAEDMNWTVSKVHEYISIPDVRIGSSFDFFINDDAILEIKNVDSLIYRDKWIDDGINLEAPPHIELQVQHQMLVSGRSKAYICALVGGNSVTLIERQANRVVQSAILKKVNDFWMSIDGNNPPSPDFTRDAKAIIEMNQKVYDGSLIEANEEISRLALEYKIHADAEKNAKESKEVIKAKLLVLIGKAEKVKGQQFTISAGMVKESEVSYKREAFRNFKINWRKTNE